MTTATKTGPCQCAVHQAHRAKFGASEPRIGWLSAHLNDGKRTGFKPGDKVQFSDGYHHAPLIGEVLGAGPARSELLVTCDGSEWIIRRQIPLTIGKVTARVMKRDSLGRFTR